MGVLSLDYLCLGKTAQLSIPVTRKGVRHIFSFSFKPEDSVEGGGVGVGREKRGEEKEKERKLNINERPF